MDKEIEILQRVTAIHAELMAAETQLATSRAQLGAVADILRAVQERRAQLFAERKTKLDNNK